MRVVFLLPEGAAAAAAQAPAQAAQAPAPAAVPAAPTLSLGVRYNFEVKLRFDPKNP